MKEKILYFLTVLLIVYSIIIPLKINAFLGLTSILVLLIAIFYYITAFSTNTEKRYVPIIFFVLIVFLYVFKQFPSTAFTPILFFLSMLTIWPVSKNIRIEKIGILRFEYIVLFVVILLLASSSFAYRGVTNFGKYEGEVYYGQSLTLGFNNPNEAAIILYYVITIFISIILTSEKKLNRVLWIPVAVLVYFLYKTSSRSCLLSLLSISIFFLFARKNVSIINNRIVIWILLLVPLIFAILYPIAALHYAQSNLEILGKPVFSGRDYLFTEELANFFENPIFGDINQYQFNNSLNGYLTILFNTGICGFSIYLVTIYTVIRSLANRIVSKSQLFAFLSIIGVYIIASTESVLLVGGGRWYILMLSLFVLANNNMQDSNGILKTKSI